MSLATPALVSVAQEVLSFNIGQERYALSLTEIQEIRAFEPPTRLPNQSPFQLGVLNIRGTMVPLVDLRLLLGVGTPEVNQLTSVIVLAQGEQFVGLVVDSVCDVLELPAGCIRPAPFNQAQAIVPIKGLATVQGQMYICIEGSTFFQLAAALI